MSNSLPRLPLGISDFAKLREPDANYLYVDKTQVLFNLLQDSNYIFLARPRRFGKSLLCSTLKYLYEGRHELYAGLAIEPLWDWSKTNPVMHLSMTDMGSSTLDILTSDITFLLSGVAKSFGVPLKGASPASQLSSLVSSIYAQTGRRVVVIVDEYEKPVHDHLTDLAMARKMRDVLSSFYGALKGCDAHLEKVFITGIGRMVRTSIFSELNQMKDVTLLPAAAELCGYTEAELHRDFALFVKRLAQANALTEGQTWDTLRERYNGYWWGTGEKVYNPWAILNCVDDRTFGSYWWASGTPGMLVDMAATLDRPDGNLEGVKATNLSLLFDITQPKPVPLLWQSGYLTIKDSRADVFTLGFPNAEVREAWFSMMLGHFCGPNGADGQTSAAIMLASLRTGDRPQFEQAMTSLFASIPYDLHVNREAYYHSIFFAVLQAIGGEVFAEVHTDKGRIDAVLKTRDTIYVIEFKLGSVEEALAQLNARRYDEPYLSDPRPVVLLAAGGFEARAVQCLWEEVEKC